MSNHHHEWKVRVKVRNSHFTTFHSCCGWVETQFPTWSLIKDGPGLVLLVKLAKVYHFATWTSLGSCGNWRLEPVSTSLYLRIENKYKSWVFLRQLLSLIFILKLSEHSQPKRQRMRKERKLFLSFNLYSLDVSGKWLECTSFSVTFLITFFTVNFYLLMKLR